MENVKTLNELLAEHNKTIKDIAQIYHGKDHWCRCGCGGKYFEPGEKGFARATNTLNKNPMYESVRYETASSQEWLNITVSSYTNNGAGTAYTFYFE